jgi:hypothetical protein
MAADLKFDVPRPTNDLTDCNMRVRVSNVQQKPTEIKEMRLVDKRGRAVCLYLDIGIIYMLLMLVYNNRYNLKTFHRQTLYLDREHECLFVQIGLKAARNYIWQHTDQTRR